MVRIADTLVLDFQVPSSIPRVSLSGTDWQAPSCEESLKNINGGDRYFLKKCFPVISLLFRFRAVGF
jgi:hypothetical protein